jgi:hypothetical protein
VSIADFQAPCGALNGRVLQGIDAAKFRYNVDLFTSNCATMSCRAVHSTATFLPLAYSSYVGRHLVRFSASRCRSKV